MARPVIAARVFLHWANTSGTAFEQQNEYAHGDKEMSRAVIGVHQLDKPHMRQEKILN
jgi:hypothetical protein